MLLSTYTYGRLSIPASLRMLTGQSPPPVRHTACMHVLGMQVQHVHAHAHIHVHVHAYNDLGYLRGRSRVGIHATEIVEAYHDQEVVAIEDVECEHDRVLGGPEVRNNVDVHGTHNHGDPS